MSKWLWLDLEMSGLEVDTCRILEVAAIVTDYNFKEQGSFHRIVKQPQFVLDRMDEWCAKVHGKSGLTEAVKKGVAEQEVENQLLSFLSQHFGEEKNIILGGNSIAQDRKFIDRYWKKISQCLHYRMLDVSSFKIVFSEKYGQLFEKGETHRALDDIRNSIKELQFYLNFVEVKPS